jgi:hypothetical protein
LGRSTVKPVSSLLGDQSPLHLSSPLETEHCPSESADSNIDATNDHTATIRETSAIPDPGNTEHLSDTKEPLNNLQEVDAAAHKTYSAAVPKGIIYYQLFLEMNYSFQRGE